MADCSETLREMFVFLDGELTPAEQHEIEAHLDGCNDCLGAFEFHHVLKATVRKVCREEAVPVGLVDRITACFGEAGGPQGS